MKQVEFNLDLVKKIQAGEVKGCIKTRDGRKARFLCEVNNNEFPLVFVYDNIRHKECAFNHTKNGFYCFEEYNSNCDIIIEIEESKIKPFDKVLVRDSDTDIWVPALYQFYSERGCGERHHFANDIFYIQCISYEGNEHLVGTTNKPKED